MDISLTQEQIETLRERHGQVFKPPFLQRHSLSLAFGFCVVYSLFCWWFFGIGKALERANWDIAGSYLADWVSYEVRPDVEFENGYFEITYPRFSPLGDNPDPSWITTERSMVTIQADGPAVNIAGNTGAASGDGLSFMAPEKPAEGDASQSSGGLNFMAPQSSATSTGRGNDRRMQAQESREERITRATVAIGNVTITAEGSQVRVERAGEEFIFDIERDEAVNPRSDLPQWAFQREAGEKVRFNLGWAGRFEIQDDEIKIWRRFLGWENFFFDTDSKFWPLSGGERVASVFSSERLDPSMSNAALAWQDFTMNASWQHWDVWVKLLQTIVMAFVGTIFATILAFPLAFIAARNITPNRIANHLLKRIFDFLRSVDMLIWALFFTRAFGPGPLAGISAIFLTDTGTLGKLYSEALENIDDRQREGVKSVGASPILMQRYGVVPQVLPVFLSQSLYFWESNTRSATIIGAVGAGGIGLKLWEAMRTNQDWENVAYMVILILIVVFVFDAISNVLRSRLTGGPR